MNAWADRKAAVQAEAEALANAERAAMVAGQQAALAEKPEAEVLAALDLPNPDDMQPGDDFSAFMKDAVPTALRNRALRSLWRSDPVLANVDMLVDYGEDFTRKNDPVGVAKTIYRVGKGMLSDEEIAPEEAAAPEVGVEPPELIEPEAAPVLAVGAPPKEEPPLLAPRRRMRFEFETGGLPVSIETEIT